MRRIILVGLGGMGRVHVANYAYLGSKAQVVAAVGRTKADRDFAASKDLPFHEDIRSALEAHPEVDTVDICTPSYCHHADVIEALSYKRDVICEKPLALTLADAEEMYAKADEAGCKLIPAFVCRHTKEYAFLRECVLSGHYGAVRDAMFTRLSAMPAWSEGSWLFNKAKSGLVPFDLMVHDLDMALSLFPLEAAEMERFSTRSVDAPCVNYHRLSFKLPGCHVGIEAGWLDAPIPFTATWRVIFDKAVIGNDGTNVFIHPSGGSSRQVDIEYPVTVSTGINVPPTGWYYEELDHIIDELDGVRPPLVKKEEVLKLTTILSSLDEG